MISRTSILLISSSTIYNHILILLSLISFSSIRTTLCFIPTSKLWTTIIFSISPLTTRSRIYKTFSTLWNMSMKEFTSYIISPTIYKTTFCSSLSFIKKWSIKSFYTLSLPIYGLTMRWILSIFFIFKSV